MIFRDENVFLGENSAASLARLLSATGLSLPVQSPLLYESYLLSSFFVLRKGIENE